MPATNVARSVSLRVENFRRLPDEFRAPCGAVTISTALTVEGPRVRKLRSLGGTPDSATSETSDQSRRFPVGPMIVDDHAARLPLL